MNNKEYDVLKTLLNHLELRVDKDGYIYDFSDKLMVRDTPIVFTKEFVKDALPFLPHKIYKVNNILVDIAMSKYELLEIPYIRTLASTKLEDGKYKVSVSGTEGEIIESVIDSDSKRANVLLIYKLLDPMVDLDELRKSLG